MEIKHGYPIKVDLWAHKNEKLFIGANNDSLIYILGISPQDPQEKDIYYANVGIEFTITNANNGIVFSTKTLSTFKISVGGNEDVSNSFLFDIIKKAFDYYVAEFSRRTQQTNLERYNITLPQQRLVDDEISQCIDFWNNHIRRSGLN